MGVTINTNMAALNAGRQLNKTRLNLSRSFERLSSGLRINKAADDAGGLKIAEKFTAQIRGLGQATRNANDGISLVQTVEGAMSESTNILQRIRELAVQSANGTYTTGDRQSLQDETDALVSEMDRIANNTTFNGRKVLDGSFKGHTLQIGADAGQTLSISINGARSSDLGKMADGTSDDTSTMAASTGANIAINGDAIVASAQFAEGTGTNGRSSSSAYALARAVNASGLNVSAEALETEITGGTGLAAGSSVVINGVTIDNTGGTSALTVQETADLINNSTGETGVEASVDGAGALQLNVEDGRDLIFDSAATLGFGATNTIKGDLRLTSNEAINISTGSTALGFTGNLISLGTSTVKDIDLTSADGAKSAIEHVDAALATVGTRRGELGATQNRLESTISNLSNVSENLNGARSRLLDVDFASETVNMTKGMMLQQAGAAILAQAKSSSQFALSLLQ